MDRGGRWARCDAGRLGPMGWLGPVVACLLPPRRRRRVARVPCDPRPMRRDDEPWEGVPPSIRACKTPGPSAGDCTSRRCRPCTKRRTRCRFCRCCSDATLLAWAGCYGTAPGRPSLGLVSDEPRSSVGWFSPRRGRASSYPAFPRARGVHDATFRARVADEHAAPRRAQPVMVCTRFLLKAAHPPAE